MDVKTKLECVLETITSMSKGMTKLKREVEDLLEEYSDNQKKRGRSHESEVTRSVSSYESAQAALSKPARDAALVLAPAVPASLVLAPVVSAVASRNSVQASKWNTSTTSSKKVVKSVPTKVGESLLITLVDLWPNDPPQEIAKSRLFDFQQRECFRSNVKITDTGNALLLLPMLSERSLREYRSEFNDPDLIFLLIQLMIAVGDKGGKILIGLQNSRSDNGKTEIINWPSSEKGGAILTFAQLKNELSKKSTSSTLYLRMSCTRPEHVEAGDSDREGYDNDDNVDEEEFVEEDEVDIVPAVHSVMMRNVPRERRPVIRPDFVSTQEAEDDDFDKVIENLKYARRVKGSEGCVTKDDRDNANALLFMSRHK